MGHTPRPQGTLAGVLLYDKPSCVTSHDIVARVRRGFARGTKVGHAGTLDPFATGLLLILIGRATRVQRFLLALPKTYEVTARFGATSTTGDPDGEIVTTGVVPDGDLELPVGCLRQRPPAYSAVKVGGRRAYSLARAGEAVELAERPIEVHRFEEMWREGDRRGFLIECSSGTYVRSLISELGDAYCEELRRTRVGSFTVAAADPGTILPLQDALAFLPELRLDDEQARRVEHGGRLALGPGQSPPAEVVRLTDENGLIALGEPVSDGQAIKPVVVLRLAPPGAR
ncbi:MAG: tRNA pseudouridine(55) synthase TruB [Solirubrobacteraceae bacterium]